MTKMNEMTNMSKQTEAMKLALDKVQEFKSRWCKVPPFADRVNKATREAITLAQVPIFELEHVLQKALAEQPAPSQYGSPELQAMIVARAMEKNAAEHPAPVAKPRKQEPVSDRENAIIRFALHQFMSNAYSHMNAAAQDKDGRHYTVGAVEKFAKDAKDAEALLSRLQFKAPQPAQRKPWVGLTDEEIEKLREKTFSTGNPYCPVDSKSMRKAARAIEAKLKEKNT